MASAVVLRDDFDGVGLRRLARLSGDANQVRRLLALAMIYDGGARHAAAQVGGVGLQTVRDWVLRFNASGPDGLCSMAKPPVPVQCLAQSISGRLPRLSSRARSRRRMVWCAGGS